MKVEILNWASNYTSKGVEIILGRQGLGGTGTGALGQEEKRHEVADDSSK